MNKINKMIIRAQSAIACRKGEAYIDSGVKILIAIVIGALLLTALYFLFAGGDAAKLTDGNSVLGRLSKSLTDLFNFKNAVGGL